MNDPTRRFPMWLKVYPKAYRDVRGIEILSTLLDATDGNRPALRDLFPIVVHALKVRIRQFVKGPGRRPLPQPVRFVTWILVGSAASAWANAILDHGYPKHPGPSPNLIVTGFILLGLNFLLQARRRLLFVGVIGVLGVFVWSIVTQARPIYGGAILAAPYSLLVLLLIIGWKRYMTAIANDHIPSQISEGVIPHKTDR
jgi:hypothetical protein